jgi:DNA-binding response OmpR family regulator
MKVLLVEDDLSMGFLLSEFLEGEGFEVKLCRDGASGLKCFKRHGFDFVILDVMMPKMDGFDLAREIRLENARIPFLFLTARVLKADKLRGFDLGAEDYITKPFDEEAFLGGSRNATNSLMPKSPRSLRTRSATTSPRSSTRTSTSSRRSARTYSRSCRGRRRSEASPTRPLAS